MILYANGCSWTWGSGEKANHKPKEERESLLWPHFLGQFLNAEKVVNNSLGGGSNPRIFRTTFDWLSKQTTQDLSKVVAVIQFTEISRYEIYVPNDKNNRYEFDEERWMACKVDCVTPIIPNENRKIIMEDNNTRLSYFTETEGVYLLLNQAHSIANLFKSFGVNKFYFWNNNNFWNSPDNYCDYARDNLPFIDYDAKKTGWKYERVGNVVHSDGSIGFDAHPTMPDGHKQLAKLIYDRLPLKAIRKKN
jgi:hypothetical protein